jgi:sugar lactone lactonase YvrE
MIAAGLLLGAMLVPMSVVAQEDGEGGWTSWTFATGFNRPRGLDIDESGNLLVGDQGTGNFDAAVVRLSDRNGDDVIDGSERQVVLSDMPSTYFSLGEGGEAAAEVSSISDIEAVDGEIYTLIGGFQVDPFSNRHGSIWSTTETSPGNPLRQAGPLVSISAAESELNPDGGMIDSNPYKFVRADNGNWYVTDAGANAVFVVNGETGEVAPYAVFPPAAVPDGFPVPIPFVESVPTGIAIGPDGALYVGELTGGPFPGGAARVWRLEDVDGDGTASGAGEMEVFADGLTTVTALAFDNDGHLLVAEFRGDLVIFGEPSMGRILHWDDGSWDVIADGLVSPTGLAVGTDGTVYVAQEFLGTIAAVRFSDGGTPPPPPPPPPPGPTVKVVAEGLNSPRGIDVDAEGMVYVAQAGSAGDDCITVGEGEEATELCFGTTGAVSMVMDGEVVDVISDVTSYTFSAPENVGPQDVVVGDDGSVYSIVGLGTNPADREMLGERATGLGWLIEADGEGGYEAVLDVSAYEAEANPGGGDEIDSNPFSIIMTDDGWVISDSGANALLAVDGEGTISTLATFADRMVEAPEFLGAPPGTMIPMQAVPTGVTQGPDGAYYVGELTGFPFVQGMARVWRVMPGEEPEVYAEGFTNIIDVAFDAEGNLYVLEMFAGGLLAVNPEDPATLAGHLHMVDADGNVEEVLTEGLVAPSGMDFGPDGTLYISNFGIMPGMGQIVSVTWE